MKCVISVVGVLVFLLALCLGNDFNGHRVIRQFGALRPSLGGDANYDPSRNMNNGNTNYNNNNRNNMPYPGIYRPQQRPPYRGRNNNNNRYNFNGNGYGTGIRGGTNYNNGREWVMDGRTVTGR